MIFKESLWQDKRQYCNKLQNCITTAEIGCLMEFPIAAEKYNQAINSATEYHRSSAQFDGTQIAQHIKSKEGIPSSRKHSGLWE